MLTEEEFVEASALHRRGWSISAIARHLGRDRKTIRAYLAGERAPGVRRSSRPDVLAPFVPYIQARLEEDPHLWGSALYDEVVALGYPRSHVTLARRVRCAGCARAARPARASRAARRSRSSILPARRSSGTG